MDTFMENSAPSNVWTYFARWHRYFASLIETNVFEISCLLCMSFCFVILYVTIWCKDNKLIIYLSKDNKQIFNSIIVKKTRADTATLTVS